MALRRFDEEPQCEHFDTKSITLRKV